MDELLADFIAETREMLDAIAGALVRWESAPEDRALLDAIFRFVHTVKGSSGFLDLPRLGHLSHAAEDALAAVRDGTRACTPAMVSAVLGIVDRIGQLTDVLEAEGRLPDGDDEALIAAFTLTEVAEPAPVETAEIEPLDIVRSPARSMRLPVDLLDRMMAGVSDVVLARNELARALRDAEVGADARLAFERLTLCVADIRDAITRTRMTRIDGLFAALPRMVRDLGHTLGRQVRLETDGGDVELDREMIEMIRDPLTHIVRNSVDHGIESPQERVAAGKPATGRLTISARQAGNQILIDAVDDGRGIDADRLANKAIAAGVLTPEQVQSMSWARKLDLMFMPGVSTAKAVTAISGRGVGMDVVRANVERIGGTVEVESRPGRGVRLTMRVPLTLTIIPALTIACGRHHFAVPRSGIDEIVRANGVSVRVGRLGDGAIVEIRGRTLPLLDLGAFLECEGARAGDAKVLVVLRGSGGERFVAAVDAVLDHEELVVKPAAPAIMATGLFAGTTLPDDSRPMLLLDIGGIAAAAGIEAGIGESVAEEEAAPERRMSILLFRDLDGRERAVHLGLVEHIHDVSADDIAESGGRLRLAQDGQLLQLQAFGPLPGATVRVLLLSDGTTRMAYAVAGVADVVEVADDLSPSAVPGPVAGVLLHEGRQVELVDAHWLFADLAGAGARAAPLCRLSGVDDAWSAMVLAPLLIAAGYRIAGAGDDADVTIVAGGEGEADGPLVRLRDEATPQAGEASIWRYDRAGLLDAVRMATAGGVR